MCRAPHVRARYLAHTRSFLFFTRALPFVFPSSATDRSMASWFPFFLVSLIRKAGTEETRKHRGGGRGPCGHLSTKRAPCRLPPHPLASLGSLPSRRQETAVRAFHLALAFPPWRVAFRAPRGCPHGQPPSPTSFLVSSVPAFLIKEPSAPP